MRKADKVVKLSQVGTVADPCSLKSTLIELFCFSVGMFHVMNGRLGTVVLDVD
jgi:hypothetical protein